MKKKWLSYCKNDKKDISNKIDKYCNDYGINRKTIDNEKNLETVGFTQMMYVIRNIIEKLKLKRSKCFYPDFKILARLPNYNQQITVMHRFGVTYEESINFGDIVNISAPNNKKIVLKELENIFNYLLNSNNKNNNNKKEEKENRNEKENKNKNKNRYKNKKRKFNLEEE